MLEEQQLKQCKQILRRNRLNPIKKLGKGAFGVVFLVSETDFTTYDTHLYSVKCTNKKTFVKKPALRRYLKQEILLLEVLDHPNIVKLIRTFEDDGWIFMVMEYCNMGNLAHIQNKKLNTVFSLSECKKILIQIINGLQYMHQRKVLHRDIKPENILITKAEQEGQEEEQVKICDLGFSRQFEESVGTFCGTTYYMAPEIYEQKKYNQKVDIWALGVLMFMMLFGSHPFRGVNILGDIQKKCSGGFNMNNIKTSRNESIGQQNKLWLESLFCDIFVIEPKRRITLRQLKERLCPSSICVKKSPSQENTQHSEHHDDLFYKQKIQYVQNVWHQVKSLSFLRDLQSLVLKYYLNKVCISILTESSPSNKQNTSTNNNLYDQLSSQQAQHLQKIIQQLPKIPIKKLSEVFNPTESTSFKQYKQGYRLVVGHAFYQAHKLIEQNQLRNKIKLKLFCCHVINRVFQTCYSGELFRYYFDWLEAQDREKNFNLTLLYRWINEQSNSKIVETIEFINYKFYKKNK